MPREARDRQRRRGRTGEQRREDVRRPGARGDQEARAGDVGFGFRGDSWLGGSGRYADAGELAVHGVGVDCDGAGGVVQVDAGGEAFL